MVTSTTQGGGTCFHYSLAGYCKLQCIYLLYQMYVTLMRNNHIDHISCIVQGGGTCIHNILDILIA